MPRQVINVALIGLSASATTSWASNAHLPYLISSKGKEKYNLIALLNSSVETAKQAIAHYSLPPETRAYGNPHDLAADPDVDLVVCSTRVDKHASTVRPSIEAGKEVFVEWPLAENPGVAKDLAALAAQKNVRTVVGLQGRVAPFYEKVTEILGSGRIGKVLSSEVLASGGSVARDSLPEGLKYFTDKKVGGNVITIGFGHLFDNIQYVLGTVQNAKVTAQTRRPQVGIRDGDGNIRETVTADVPDLIHVSGALPGSTVVSDGATLAIRYRRGDPFKGEPDLVWTIEGEKGELRLISQAGSAIQALSQPGVIEIHDFATDEVETAKWSWHDWQEELPLSAKNIGALYEAFADGLDFPTFLDAVERHEQISSFLG